ncbi:MAG: hypothetical protein ACM3S2_02470 [Ignavibacteriales bacterium]
MKNLLLIGMLIPFLLNSSQNGIFPQVKSLQRGGKTAERQKVIIDCDHY